MSDPDVWGFHSTVYYYTVASCVPQSPTQKEVSLFYDLLGSIPHVLPCDACKMNSQQWWNEPAYEPALRNALSQGPLEAVRWFYGVKSRVNLELEKDNLSFENVQSMVMHGYRDWEYHTWRYLLFMCLNVPVDKDNEDVPFYRRFFSAIPYGFPDPELRSRALQFWPEMVQKLDQVIGKEPEDHARWIWEIHQRLHPPKWWQASLSFEQLWEIVPNIEA
jgi:hypothetical protein